MDALSHVCHDPDVQRDASCLITGVGPGTGTALARRFAAGGYRVAMLARDEERLKSLAADVLRRNFEVDTMALLELARLAAPAMIEAGDGVILASGNTSAHRGKANFAGFAPGKAAQRILAQSMARSLGPRGVHVAYVTIDAVIDLPWTRQMAPEAPDEYFIQPRNIAAECWHVAHQARTAWSFDVEIRPFGETW